MGARRRGYAAAACCIGPFSRNFTSDRRTTRRASATGSYQSPTFLPRTCHGCTPCLSIGCPALPTSLYALCPISTAGTGVSAGTQGPGPSIHPGAGTRLSTAAAGICSISSAELPATRSTTLLWAPCLSGLSWLRARSAGIRPVWRLSRLLWLSSLLWLAANRAKTGWLPSCCQYHLPGRINPGFFRWPGKCIHPRAVLNKYFCQSSEQRDKR